MPTRPCWVEIDTRRLQHNYQFLRSLAPPATECLAVVKANAYGHGLEICAAAATPAGAAWLGVTSVEEGLAARAVCPQARVLVMGGVFPGQEAAAVMNKLTPAVWTEAQIDALESAARTAAITAGGLPIHLEIDTGMSRQGFAPDELEAALARFGAGSPLRIEAIMTHLYASDEADGTATAQQLQNLQRMLNQVQAALPSGTQKPLWLSAGASAALLGGDGEALSSLANTFGMKLMLRQGLALYGVTPRFNPPFESVRQPVPLHAALARLQPVLSWKTRVTSLRTVAPGTEIGYNGTFVATEEMRLALIPAGYADGLDRRLGNRFNLLVRGQLAPLVGRVSMDQAVLDVTEVPDIQVGDEVVIIGPQGNEAITAYDHADAAETIPWEVFTRIASRVERGAV